MAAKEIFWMHDDCLRATAIPTGMPAIYCFDEHWHQQNQFGHKRLLFLYESVQETGAQIFAGDPIAAILHFAKTHRAEGVVTMATPCPRVRELSAQLAGQLSVRTMPDDGFVTVAGPFDLKRFSRYWTRVRHQALSAR